MRNVSKPSYFHSKSSFYDLTKIQKSSFRQGRVCEIGARETLLFPLQVVSCGVCQPPPVDHDSTTLVSLKTSPNLIISTPNRSANFYGGCQPPPFDHANLLNWIIFFAICETVISRRMLVHANLVPLHALVLRVEKHKAASNLLPLAGGISNCESILIFSLALAPSMVPPMPLAKLRSRRR